MNALPEEKRTIDCVVDGVKVSIGGEFALMVNRRIIVGKREFSSWDALGNELLKFKLIAKSKRKKISFDRSELLYSYSPTCIRPDGNKVREILKEMHGYLYECEEEKIANDVLKAIKTIFVALASRERNMKH